MKKVAMILGTLFVVACDQKPSPSSPSESSLSTGGNSVMSTPLTAPLLAQGQLRVGFGFNGTVSGFPTGEVFITGGGSYNRVANLVDSAGGFKCLEDVLKGPLSTSINPNDPGPCRAGEGVRWDLHADFYRASNGNDESFTAKMIVSDGDSAADFPGVNLWVERVGCGTALAVNFNK
jgi:hypothetical protein